MKKIVFFLTILSILASANSLKEIKSKDVIKIGLSRYMPPFSKVNDNGDFTGFEVELARKIASKIVSPKGKILFFPIEQEDRLNAVKSNKVDLLIAAYTRNDERAKQIDFSLPYFSINLATTSLKSKKIRTEGDLVDKKVLVIPNTNSDIYTKKKGISQVFCRDNGECFRRLKAGEADAYMHNIVSVAAIPLMNPEYELGIKQIGNVFMDCVTTQKNNKELLEKVNSIILELAKEGFFRKNYKNTFEPFYKGTVQSKYFLLDDLYNMFH